MKGKFMDSAVLIAVAFGDPAAEERCRIASWTVNRRVRAAGIRRDKGPICRDQRIYQLRRAGVKIKVIAELFNLHPSRIYAITSNN